MLGIPWMDVGPEDRFLFSYPRSGNTWLRHVIQHMAFDSLPSGYEEMEGLLPTIDTLEFQSRLEKMPEGRRFFKSHLPYAPYFLDGKVIYIVRDGRDVMISYYDYFRNLHDYRGDLDSFLRKFTSGWFRYGTWRNNVGSWVDHRDHPNMLLIRFEDLRADPAAVVKQIAEFSGLPTDEARIQTALDASTVDKVHSTMRSWVVAKGTSFQGGVSAGGKKNWRDKLTPEQNAIFVDHAGDLLQALDYPLD